MRAHGTHFLIITIFQSANVKKEDRDRVVDIFGLTCTCSHQRFRRIFTYVNTSGNADRFLHVAIELSGTIVYEIHNLS